MRYPPILLLLLACATLSSWPATPRSRAEVAAAPAIGATDAGGDLESAPGSDYDFYLGESDRPDVVETPRLELGPDAAPWLPRLLGVLERNRPPLFTLGQVALLTGDRGAQYVVVKWRERDSTTSRRPLEFHKVIAGPDGGRRLEWLRSYHEHAELFTPSGDVIFEGEPPVAVVFLWNGGSGTGGMRLRILQMARNTVDITPDWAGVLVDVVDLDGDGQYEAVAHDWGWDNRLRPQFNWPRLPVVLSRVQGRFMDDCRRFAGLFHRTARDMLHWARGYAWKPGMLAPFLSGAFLNYLQAGAFEAARGLLPSLEVEARHYVRDDIHDADFTAEQAIEDHVALLDWAIEHPEAGCPLSAPGVLSGPNGVLRREGRGYAGCTPESPC